MKAASQEMWHLLASGRGRAKELFSEDLHGRWDWEDGLRLAVKVH